MTGLALDGLLRRSVAGVGPYVPGTSAAEVKARFGREDMTRLNWNENLFGPLPGVLEETAAQLAEVWKYPDEAHDELRVALAEWAGADVEQVIPGHGIQALTLALIAAFVEPDDVVIVPWPTYGLYAQACKVAGARVVRVNAPTEGPRRLELDLEAIAAAAVEHRAKLVWICDPNNPTGARLDRADWDNFLDALPPGCLAIADEAYRDYIKPAERIHRIADIQAGRPVIVLRTFSKIFGLAGLRLGYLLVHESLASHVNAVQEPFNVNRAALAAGLASLRRGHLLEARRLQVREARARLQAPLAARGIRALPSDANFVLLDLADDDVRVAESLAAQEGILVRAGSEFGLSGYVRVTTAAEELMDLVGDRIAATVSR
jgi:histidinol-phosphate aminotransferase